MWFNVELNRKKQKVPDTFEIKYWAKERGKLMKYCTKCGKEIDDAAVICPHCGVQQGKIQNATTDSGSIGWGALGCCIPLVGLILWLVWRGEKPNNARMAGIGALVGVAGIVIWYLLMFVIGGAASLMY